MSRWLIEVSVNRCRVGWIVLHHMQFDCSCPASMISNSNFFSICPPDYFPCITVPVAFQTFYSKWGKKYITDMWNFVDRKGSLKIFKVEKVPLKPFLWLDKFKTERQIYLIRAPCFCLKQMWWNKTRKKNMNNKTITYIIVNRVSRTMRTFI